MGNLVLRHLSFEKWIEITKLAQELEIPSYNLIAVIAFESAETFSPQVGNPKSTAVGLIQITSVGIQSIPQYSLDKVGKMNFYDQLWGPVKAYLIANKAEKLHSLADLYMTVFAPSRRLSPWDFVLYKAPRKSYNDNKLLDKENKGFITKGDAASQVYRMLERVVLRVKKLDEERI